MEMLARIIRIVKNKGASLEGKCTTCKWYEDFAGVCFNGNSEHVADYVNCGLVYGCKEWEEKKHGSKER